MLPLSFIHMVDPFMETPIWCRRSSRQTFFLYKGWSHHLPGKASCCRIPFWVLATIRGSFWWLSSIPITDASGWYEWLLAKPFLLSLNWKTLPGTRAVVVINGKDFFLKCVITLHCRVHSQISSLGMPSESNHGLHVSPIKFQIFQCFSMRGHNSVAQVKIFFPSYNGIVRSTKEIYAVPSGVPL